MKDAIERVWLYSHYYGDMLFTAQRLRESEESNAAFTILMNATELIFKSLRENFSQTFNQDIEYLRENGYLSDDEATFFEVNSIREIRNIMAHRDAYQYCIESPNGKALPLVETSTWDELYDNCAPTVLAILHNAVSRMAFTG